MGGVISEMTTQRTRHMDGNSICKVTSDLSFFFTDQLIIEEGNKLTDATNMSLYGSDHECVRLL